MVDDELNRQADLATKFYDEMTASFDNIFGKLTADEAFSPVMTAMAYMNFRTLVFISHGLSQEQKIKTFNYFLDRCGELLEESINKIDQKVN